MPLFDHFETIAPVYDWLFRPRDPAKLAKLADLPGSDFLLDVGGGTGTVARALTTWSASIIVADLSFGMLSGVVRKGGLTAVCAPAEKLPFGDESFDRIIMVDALHHVCDQAVTVREMWRLLRPGGKIVVEEPDIRCFAVIILAIVEKLLLMRSHFLSPPEIARLFPPGESTCRIVIEGYTAWIIVEK